MDRVKPGNGTLATIAIVNLAEGRKEAGADNSEELDLLLQQAYEALVPEGVVMASIGDAMSWRRNPRSKHGRSTVDVLGSALHRAGFCEPKFEAFSSGASRAIARRGRHVPPGKRDLILSVVVPVYNERATFRELMDLLLAKRLDGIEIEIIIVESNSSDGTRDDVVALTEHPRVTAVFEDAPSGKGHAVRAGLRLASGDFVLIQDADLEYSLDDYERLLAPLRSYEASFVLGRRNAAHGRRGMRHFEAQSLTSRFMNVGHVLFLSMFNIVYRQSLSDPFTMYKVFRRDCIAGMSFECDRFDFDWELTAKLIRAGYDPLEIPVSYRSRSFTEGKKIQVLRDPISWVKACARYRSAPVFEPIAGQLAGYRLPPLPNEGGSCDQTASERTSRMGGIHAGSE